eukprot:CAMPEP_0184656142 /NCGR_PEP_ID=MMETSP0308-20130426/15751_1 /TAXON_ID=38269 /ORGANISM="Gloeochaete witrockiana, Strain SAG 46.84" /LENGTH=120 /DNA_ID=CAMNT_0027093099 /DNA_START=201 /DNA_END=563 /DNA_ORIENTATION=-
MKQAQTNQDSLPSAIPEEQNLSWGFKQAVQLFKSDIGKVGDIVTNVLPKTVGVGAQDYTSTAGPAPGEFGYKRKEARAPLKARLEERDSSVRTRQVQNISAPGATDYLGLARSLSVSKRK